MKLNNAGYDLIKNFEGLKLSAYQDSAGIWTIGYGNIHYEDFSKVKKGDKISLQRAEEVFKFFADRFARQVDAIITSCLNQNQFNAVVSFAYNVGIGALQKSTILKKINKNPHDPTITAEFLKWINSGGRPIEGLKNRRKKEAALHFKIS